MANVQNLQEKVAKAKETVEKKKATIARHEKQLVKKVAVLEKASGRAVDLSNVDAHKWDENRKSYDYYWEACDVAGKLRDIDGANKKLKEAETILANWEAKLQKELDKEDFVNNGIPQVIKDFLDMWGELVYDWHVKKYDKFLVFKKDLYAKEVEAIKECQHLPYRERKAYMKEKGLDNIQKRLANFAGAVVLQMATYRNENDRLAFLTKTIEEDKKAKAIDLVNRINAVVGEITDASHLSVSEKGNLDGIIKGTKGKAKVETIGAGGYNIQCFHYRTLVHEIK